MEFIKVFIEASNSDSRAVFLLNLILCLAGLSWTAGTPALQRELMPWRGWMMFWAGTAFYYLLGSFNPTWPFYVSGLGLYVATSSLLVSLAIFAKRAVLTLQRAAAGAIVLVSSAAIADILLVSNLRSSGVHQTLTALAIIGWAWQLRNRDESKSLTILVYGLLQLPLQPLLSTMGLASQTYELFVSATFIAYISMKLTLIPAVCVLVKRPEEKSLAPAPSVA